MNIQGAALPCLELWGNLCVYVYEMSVASSNAAVAYLALFFCPNQIRKDWLVCLKAGQKLVNAYSLTTLFSQFLATPSLKRELKLHATYP